MNVTELMLKLRKPFMPPAAGSAADMSAAGGPDAGALLPAEPAAGALPVGEKEVQKAIEALVKYKAGKAALEARIIEDERWYKLRHWEVMRGKRPEATRPAPTSAWLFNTLQNKHADAADNYPQPNVLPREPMDEAAAESLSQVLPVILERNGFEGTYSENWWEKLKHGTAAYGVFWNGTLENGVGDIDLHKIDLLNIFWEPGITDLEKSKYLFVVDLADKGETQAVYPQLLGKSAGAVIDVAQYVYDDEVDTTDKALIVDCYYKVRAADGRTLLHLMKFCGETLLFASENEARYQNRGFYDHGKFPVVFDVLFPEKGTPAGFGYVAITKDPQLYIDKLGGCLLENALLATRPRYFVSDASGINREQFLDLAEPIVEVAGALDEARVRQIPVTPLSGVYFNIYRQKIEELKETSSNRDFNSGGSSGGVTAAAAIAALQEAGSKASRDMIAGSYRAYTAMVYLAIELIRQFYDEARTFRITGESSRPLPVGSAPPAAGGRYRAASEWQQLRDFEGSPADRTKSLSCNREDEGRRASGRNLGILEGAPPTAQNPLVATGQMPFPAGSTLRAIAAGMGTGASFIEFSNAGLQGDGRRPVFDVKVRAEKRNPFSQLSMNETAKELYRLGAFNPEKARESLLMLEMMEFEGIEAVKRKVAQNLALASAPPMPAMPPAPAGALPAAGAAMLPYAEQLARRAGPDMSALQKELG